MFRLESRDHAPSRQLFRNRDRPNGLVVPACSHCNNSLGPSEQVAALIANGGRGFITNESDPYAISLIQRVGQSTPDVLVEMMQDSRKHRRHRRIKKEFGLDIGTFHIGPKVNRHIQAVGAKLACALHYWETRNILPKTGGIYVQWWTNANRLDGSILSDEIWSHFGEPMALKQGKKTSFGQFEYTTAIADTKSAGLYFSAFGQSFAILGVVAHKLEFFDYIISKGAYIHRPGNFLSYEEPPPHGTIQLSYTRPLDIPTSVSPLVIPAKAGTQV